MNKDQQNYQKTPTLSIVGFIMVFIISFVGLIISLVALSKAKKSGQQDKLAKWGVIVGSVLTVLTLVVGIPVSIKTVGLINECRDSSTGSAYIDGKLYRCPNFLIKSKAQKEASYPKATADSKSITNTKVELVNSNVESTCFRFKLPNDYLLSPNTSSCQVEIRQDNGTSTGESLSSIKVLAEVGNNKIDDFFKKLKNAGSDTSTHKRITINGYEAAKATSKDGYGITKDFYFITDKSGHFQSDGNAITSYLIYGPAAYSEQLQTVIDSFTIY